MLDTFRKRPQYLAILLLFFCAYSFTFTPQALAANSQVRQKLTNPLLRYIRFKELRPFKNKIEQLIQQETAAGQCQDVAVYFRSLTNGIWMGINERKKFAPASLLKVPVMMAYFKDAEKNPNLLSTKVAFSFTFNPDAQYIKAAPNKNLKNEYTIDELIQIMIEKSDNEAALFLQRYEPMSQVVKKTFNQLGLPEITYAPGDTVGIRTYSGFFRMLYNASYLDIGMSEKALHYLSRSEYRGGIVAGVPKNITVAHKFGERRLKEGQTVQLHDAGIIYHPRNPYILGVMTKGDNLEELAGVIARISSLVYKEVDSQYQAGFELLDQ